MQCFLLGAEDKEMNKIGLLFAGSLQCGQEIIVISVFLLLSCKCSLYILLKLFLFYCSSTEIEANLESFYINIF